MYLGSEFGAYYCAGVDSHLVPSPRGPTHGHALSRGFERPMNNWLASTVLVLGMPSPCISISADPARAVAPKLCVPHVWSSS